MGIDEKYAEIREFIGMAKVAHDEGDRKLVREALDEAKKILDAVPGVLSLDKEYREVEGLFYTTRQRIYH